MVWHGLIIGWHGLITGWHGLHGGLGWHGVVLLIVLLTTGGVVELLGVMLAGGGVIGCFMVFMVLILRISNNTIF